MQDEVQIEQREVDGIATKDITPGTNKSILDSRIDTKDTHGSLQELPRDETAETHGNQVIQFLLWWLEDQWFLVALALLIVVASQVQVPATQQELKTTVVTYLCVSLIFFLTGCTLPTRTLLENYSRWKLHLFVQVQCFLMTSAVMFGVVSACATNPNFMDPGLLVGLIILGCLATTISSNVVMTRAAHGNTALTVVQSTVGNFLSPFITPALVSMYTSTGAWYTQILPQAQGGYGEIYRRVFKQLGLSIFLPLVVGQIVQNIFPGPVKGTIERFKLNKVGSICLLVIIWSTYDQAFCTHAFDTVKSSNMIFIVFISIALFFIFLGVCFSTSILWLPKADTISVCYCVPAKSPALGVPFAHVMFVGLNPQLQSKIQMPMVIFQGLQIFAGSLLTLAFRHWIRPDELAAERALDSGPNFQQQRVTNDTNLNMRHMEIPSIGEGLSVEGSERASRTCLD